MPFFLKNSSIDSGKLPGHIAFIMDGNGRWATKRGLTRSMGHRAGAASLRRTIETGVRLGIPTMTVFAFSTENWSRPKEEVEALMGMVVEFFDANAQELHDNGVQVRFLGELDALPDEARQSCVELMHKTHSCQKMVLNIALNYGARSEIIRAAKEVAMDLQRGYIREDEIDETVFSSHLYTAGQKDVDLLVRTGGEYRLSNFMLYQCSYAEIVVIDTLWPDFGEKEFLQVLQEYSKRERRFGKI